MNDEQRFYQKFRTSRKDFIETLRGSKDAQKIIDKTIFKESKSLGRHGIFTLTESIQVVRRTVTEKERANKFAEKFGKVAGMSQREFRQQGGIKGLQEML